MPELYPIFLKLENRPVLVVGGGMIALRKAESLLQAGARVRVIAPRVCAELAAMAGVEISQRNWKAGDCSGAFLVIAATDDAAVNRAVRDECESLAVPVNSVDDPPNCSFYLPAVIRRGDLRIAISTQGNVPMLAGRLREKLDELLPQQLAELTAEAARLREHLKATEPNTEKRNQQLREHVQQALNKLFPTL